MACFGSPISTIVAWPRKARSSTCHCTGSVSWNSSTSTIFQRPRIRWQAAPSGSLEGVGELAEQVVVGEDPEPALAALDLVADLQREADPAADRRRAVLVGGLEPGLGVVDGGAGDRDRLVVGEDRAVVVEGERAQVEVVDDLLDQVVEVLDEPGPGVGVAGDAERVEDHRAELVGGRDRRGVEAGQRLGDPPVAEPCAGRRPSRAAAGPARTPRPARRRAARGQRGRR